jgi:hypothetical protein
MKIYILTLHFNLLDRIRAMQLPEVAHFGFMNSIVKLEEDEMLNEMEFARMLRPYSVR